ncbi:MAG: sugar phosphate isomerase/epimerase [Anaerolineae bacterium]|nr:sugar phosphate isomerase/epimerase [Anaerolineae bacterium]
MVFGEFFQDIPLTEFAARVRAMGLTAVDLSVRADGNIRPERVETDLPHAAQTLAEAGVSIVKITTDICDAGQPLAQRVLLTARALGIRYYQTGSWIYRDFGSLRALRAEARARLRDLADLNADLELTGLIQNHSCEQLGANLADLDFVLQDIDPAYLGIYYDPAHAAIEGGGLGWLMALDLVAERIAALGVKDFRWVPGNHRHCGGQRLQSAEFCALGAGNTPWLEILLLLRRMRFTGPVVFFGEYRDENCFDMLGASAALDQTACDVQIFRRWLEIPLSLPGETP